jgi:type III secretory pathway component EscR
LEFKHPYLNDSPLPLVLEEIMKTKPIEEIEKVLEAAQIAENAAKSRACEAEEKAQPYKQYIEEANTARQEAAAFKRVRKAAQEKLS